MCGKTPDEMSTEARAALNKISQPQVPEQVERDGFGSQLELAVSSGTVDAKSALGQKFTRSLGEDEKEAIKDDDAFCWIGFSVIVLAQRTSPKTQSIAICLTFMSYGSRANNLLRQSLQGPRSV